jgi:tetratricopeptide (TPR) repeat protein
MRTKYGRAYDYLISADTHRFREEWEAAIQNYRNALTIRQDFTEAAVGLAQCLKSKGDIPAAIQQFRLALHRTPFNKELILGLAKCYIDQGSLKQAIHYYERVLKLTPDDIESLFELAWVLETSHQSDKAIAAYKQIIDKDASFLPAYNNLGNLYLRLGFGQLAEDTFRALIEKAPRMTRGYLGLAVSLDKSHRRAEAIMTYRKALKMNPDSRYAQFIQQRLEELEPATGKPATPASKTIHKPTSPLRRIK